MELGRQSGQPKNLWMLMFTSTAHVLDWIPFAPMSSYQEQLSIAIAFFWVQLSELDSVDPTLLSRGFRTTPDINRCCFASGALQAVRHRRH